MRETCGVLQIIRHKDSLFRVHAYICTSNLLLDAVFSLSHTYVLGVIKNVGRKKSRKFIGPELIREKERERALLPENLHALLVRGGGKA